jgi:hypothetical protein
LTQTFDNYYLILCNTNTPILVIIRKASREAVIFQISQPSMEKNPDTSLSIVNNDWYSEEFIYLSIVKYLKENGYKVLKENRQKEAEKADKIIIASKFFKKEMIEVKGYPGYHPNQLHPTPKSTQAKNWFSEALFNSFVNFSSFGDAEIAIALPNVGRYQTIIKNLNDYFTINDLYFRIYLVNEDGSVVVSNLNQKYLPIVT